MFAGEGARLREERYSIFRFKRHEKTQLFRIQPLRYLMHSIMHKENRDKRGYPKNRVGRKHRLHREREVIDSVRYLQLETNDDCLISFVSQLFCTDREIIIFDIYTQAVYVFDYGGKFLRKLHKQGQGPGEYATILSISIDETTNEILIVDSGSRVLCYNLSSFDYLREIQMEAIAVQKEKANSLIAYNASSITKDEQPYDYYLTRWEDGAISKGFIPIEFSSGYLMAPNYRFYTYNKELYFYPPFQSAIYKIKGESCEPCYDIQYGNYHFPPLDILKSKDNNGNYILNLRKDFYVYSAQIFENDDFLITTYYVALRTYIGIYDKKTKHTVNLLRKDFETNPATVDWLNIIASHGDSFVSILNHADLAEIDEEEIKDESLKRLLTMPEDANPILRFIRFKHIN